MCGASVRTVGAVIVRVRVRCVPHFASRRCEQDLFGQPVDWPVSRKRRSATASACFAEAGHIVRRACARVCAGAVPCAQAYMCRGNAVRAGRPLERRVRSTAHIPRLAHNLLRKGVDFVPELREPQQHFRPLIAASRRSLTCPPASEGSSQKTKLAYQIAHRRGSQSPPFLSDNGAHHFKGVPASLLPARGHGAYCETLHGRSPRAHSRARYLGGSSPRKRCASSWLASMQRARRPSSTSSRCAARAPLRE